MLCRVNVRKKLAKNKKMDEFCALDTKNIISLVLNKLYIQGHF